jgi:hypothetical protein
VADLRELVDEVQCGSDEPAATERPIGRDGEYGFAFTVLGRATAVVGTCEVSIYTDVDGVDLADLTDAAAQIGCSVGCSAYRDDFVAPELPELRSRLRGWLTPGIPSYIPPGLDHDR